jgi:hypothetical protein
LTNIRKAAGSLLFSSTMKFQVVLQWRASDMADYDGMVEIEELLIEKLTDQFEVDGHDFGSDEANIFVRTDDTRRAFEEIKTILSGHELWPDVRIAYRQVDGTAYCMLWPPGATAFNVR